MRLHPQTPETVEDFELFGIRRKQAGRDHAWLRTKPARRTSHRTNPSLGNTPPRRTKIESLAERHQATAELAQLAKAPTWTADRYYEFACANAFARAQFPDDKQDYPERAIALLQKAIKAGYADFANMKKDTDLDPLREREDFKKLLAELEKKFPPMKEVAPTPKPMEKK